MKIMNHEGREVGNAKGHRQPKFSNQQSREWVAVPKIMDGEPVDWWYDKTYGKSMYFELNSKWYVIPIVQEFYWNSLTPHEELTTLGIRVKTSR